MRSPATQAVTTTRRVECYRPHRSAKPPTVFLFYEQYRTKEAFDFHGTAPHLAAFRERHKGLLDKPTEVEIYHSLTE